jgi:Lrp/AsnC family transcriptional regulator for asnA, asnC and gidA
MARAVTSTDRAIIRLLQRNARVSYAELSRATGIPESTVRRRMERLHQRGIIEFAMLAEPGKLGYDLRAMVRLRIDLARLPEITEALRGMPEVTFAALLTGSYDVILSIVVRSQEALVDFARRLAGVPGVRSTETFVMPLVIKPMTSWVLPEMEEPAAAAAPASPDGAGDGQPAQPVKRRRGRPRRNPAPA